MYCIKLKKSTKCNYFKVFYNVFKNFWLYFSRPFDMYSLNIQCTLGWLIWPTQGNRVRSWHKWKWSIGLWKMINPFTLFASNILNCDAELMHNIALCRSSNTVSRAVALSSVQIYLNETNIFKFLLERFFWIS